MKRSILNASKDDIFEAVQALAQAFPTTTPENVTVFYSVFVGIIDALGFEKTAPLDAVIDDMTRAARLREDLTVEAVQAVTTPLSSICEKIEAYTPAPYKNRL